MALGHESPFQIQVPLVTTTSRWRIRRGVFLRRRRKLPTIRLGGKSPRRGHFLMRVLRRTRIKCLKAYYASMQKKLKDYYHNLIKDVMEGGGATVEAYQQGLLMETSFAVPILGVSLSNFPSISGSDYHRR